MSELKAYHLPGAWGLLSVSPFCLKLDAFLRMFDVPHEAVTVAAPFGGPKGKAPWIEHDGRKIGDSSFIVEYVCARFGVEPYPGLNPAQRGQAVAIQRLVEENLYWAMVYDRWVRPENWPILKATVLAGIPGPVRPIMAPMARRGVQRQIKGHGLGIHAPDEIVHIARRDIEALAGLLGKKVWFFGDSPTLTDAVVYGLLANIRYARFVSPLKGVLAEHTNLVAFIERFRERYYPEAQLAA